MREMIRIMAPAQVLEIGTLFAETTRYLAQAMAAGLGGHITTIDPFGADRAPGIIAGWSPAMREHVSFRPDNSMSFFSHLETTHHPVGRKAPFDLVFVDGNHAFGYAFFDLLQSSLFLRPGGALVVDDVKQAGPAEAVKMFLAHHSHWQLFKTGHDGGTGLGFFPEANAAIILAPDGIEIGSIPYKIHLQNLTLTTVRVLRLRLREAPRRSGRLIATTLLNIFPTDYPTTGNGQW
jgi:hypothetical protein